jgi:hypothetical protein
MLLPLHTASATAVATTTDSFLLKLHVMSLMSNYNIPKERIDFNLKGLEIQEVFLVCTSRP